MEHFFTCPYCWQEISMVLDPSLRSQEYIEDCEVCCKPVMIHYVIENDDVVEFEATVIGQ